MIQVRNSNVIQTLRAIHALYDIGIDIIVKKEDEIKFKMLKFFFNMNYIIKDNKCEYKNIIFSDEIITIDHSIPFVSIGVISKPLIFPVSMVNMLKSRWEIKRNIKFSFCGLMTDKRGSVIKKWSVEKLGKGIEITSYGAIGQKLLSVWSKLKLHNILKNKYNDLFIWSSSAGRNFPRKSWDKDYYKLLLNSKFVLCPSGDYIWTYRFFESIMCGAIPIVEETCSAYEGFKFYQLSDNIDEVKWSSEIIEFNMRFLLQKFTLSYNDELIIKNFINDFRE